MNKYWKTLGLVVVLGLGAVGCSSANADKDELADEAKSGSASAVKPAPKPQPRIVLPAGTAIHVRLNDGVGTDTSSPGSEFQATLSDPIVIDGKTIVDKGALVRGRVVDAKKAGRVKGRATLSLALTSIERNGKAHAIDTRTYVGVAESNKKRDVGIIAGGAAIGTAIGAIAGGGKGAATGAAIGGGGGTGAVLATRGDDLHYGPETRLNFVLASDAQL